MKLFQLREVEEAIEFAEAGGIALHIWRGASPGPKPRCFKDGEQWGHLIDRDIARLCANAHRFGVRRVHVSRKGAKGQHVDLCRGPLRKAISEAEGASE